MFSCSKCWEKDCVCNDYDNKKILTDRKNALKSELAQLNQSKMDRYKSSENDYKRDELEARISELEWVEKNFKFKV